jgi:hypothetical protein
MTRPLPFALAFALGLAACQPADTPVGPEASEAPGAVEPSAAPASSSATPTSTDSVLVSPVKPGATATSGPDTAKSEDSCGADKVSERWLNSLPTADVKSAIAKAVGERPIRYYGEGDAITMDFSPQRLNVELGKDGRIKLFRCG